MGDLERNRRSLHMGEDVEILESIERVITWRNDILPSQIIFEKVMLSYLMVTSYSRAPIVSKVSFVSYRRINV